MSRRSSAKQHNVVAVGGRHVCEAAAEQGYLERIFVTDGKGPWLRRIDAPVEVLGPHELRQRFGSEGDRGVVGLVRAPQPRPADDLLEESREKNRPLVVLEDVQDPQNLGSVFRAAAAFGAAGVIRTRHRSAPVGAAVLRASVGTIFRVPWAEIGGLPNWLLRVTLPAVGFVVAGGEHPAQLELPQAVLLCFGSEGRGLRPLSEKRCDLKATLPMEAAESLNVAQAVTVALYELQRRRLST